MQLRRRARSPGCGRRRSPRSASARTFQNLALSPDRDGAREPAARPPPALEGELPDRRAAAAAARDASWPSRRRSSTASPRSSAWAATETSHCRALLRRPQARRARPRPVRRAVAAAARRAGRRDERRRVAGDGRDDRRRSARRSGSRSCSSSTTCRSSWGSPSGSPCWTSAGSSPTARRRRCSRDPAVLRAYLGRDDSKEAAA